MGGPGGGLERRRESCKLEEFERGEGAFLGEGTHGQRQWDTVVESNDSNDKITTPVRMVDHICNGKDNNSNNNEHNGNVDNDNCNYYRIAQMGSVRLHTLRMEAAS